MTVACCDWVAGASPAALKAPSSGWPTGGFPAKCQRFVDIGDPDTREYVWMGFPAAIRRAVRHAEASHFHRPAQILRPRPGLLVEGGKRADCRFRGLLAGTGSRRGAEP